MTFTFEYLNFKQRVKEVVAYEATLVRLWVKLPTFVGLQQSRWLSVRCACGAGSMSHPQRGWRSTSVKLFDVEADEETGEGIRKAYEIRLYTHIFRYVDGRGRGRGRSGGHVDVWVRIGRNKLSFFLSFFLADVVVVGLRNRQRLAACLMKIITRYPWGRTQGYAGTDVWQCAPL